MNRSLTSICSVVAILLISMSPVSAGEATDVLTVEKFLDWERVSDPRISPDGSRILYTRSWVDRMNDRWESEVWIMQADGKRKRFLTRGSDARWAPDGKRIAFLAPGEPGGQLFVLWLDAPEPTQITRVVEAPRGLRWSPDGASSPSSCARRNRTPGSSTCRPFPRAGSGRSRRASSTRSTTGRIAGASWRAATPTFSSSPPTAARRAR